MATATRKQDMPPAGGYKPIPCARIPAKSFFRGWALIGGYLGMTAGASYIYYLNWRQVHKEELEMRSAKFAIHPLLMAERDREYLKQLRRNRDEEASLMANVEGWKVGTWYGEPIFQTDPDAFIEPFGADYYVHAKLKDFKKRSHFTYWF